jgi:hypothetical protein
MKRLACILAALLLLLLAGCAAHPQKIDVQSLADDLMNNAKFDEKPEELERSVISKHYGLDDSVEARAFTASSTADEVCVVKAGSEKDAKAVYKLLQAHLDDLKESYANYQPAEVTRLDRAALRREGSCVVLLVSADEHPEEILDKYIG